MMINQDWKLDLQRRCVSAIAQLPDDELVFTEEAHAFSPPSLYQFYEELLMMRNEVRKMNRKTAGAFTRFGDVLEGIQEDSKQLRGRFNKENQDKGTGSSISRNTALTLVDLLDRAQRLENASKKHQEKGWRGIFDAREYEETQRGAIFILIEHLQKLLEEFEVEAVHVQQGDVFDPIYMKAVGDLIDKTTIENSKSQLVVSKECLSGYRIGKQCLRPSEVYLTRQNIL